ncbi:hypothetical protein [Rhizobium rhizoryzae]|uniref:hypothetical protein n=1 Tax=Rhizobium rhizoryzae TaxID=451876 RepID=UPI00289877FB|nr:hypothetical protein [Rhizobium rhizoryzae]
MEEPINKYGIPLSVWATLTTKEKEYQYNKFSRRKNWHKTSREKRDIINAKQRAWRQAHLEEKRRKDREYKAANAERCRENYRRHYYKHHAKMIEKHRRRWAKERTKRALDQAPDKIFELINKAVSRALPRFVRDDVIGAMSLAVMEGQLLVENIDKEAAKFLRSYNREFDQFKTVSLDAPLAGTDGLTLMDSLADSQTRND